MNDGSIKIVPARTGKSDAVRYSWESQELRAEKDRSYRPYGYTRPPAEGGMCVECGCTTGGHDRGCEVVS